MESNERSEVQSEENSEMSNTFGVKLRAKRNSTQLGVDHEPYRRKSSFGTSDSGTSDSKLN